MLKRILARDQVKSVLSRRVDYSNILLKLRFNDKLHKELLLPSRNIRKKNSLRSIFVKT